MPVEFRADLHIHSCLSPCSELSMTPGRIVERAASLGLNIIAICDHNTAEHVEVTAMLAERKGIRAIPGIEMNSSEEVHVLGLFGNVTDALKMQTIIYENLQPGENDEDAFGMQVLVNESEEVLGFNRRLLIGSTDVSVNRIVELIHGFNGLAIASHIDREGFGILGQLGFIPEEVKFDALEISCRTSKDEACARYGSYSHIPWIASSDAHSLEEIGRATTGFLMEHSTFEEMIMAVKGTDKRKTIF
jgi:3',5'-nucleoside bisphosphate phosphatase